MRKERASWPAHRGLKLKNVFKIIPYFRILIIFRIHPVHKEARNFIENCTLYEHHLNLVYISEFLNKIRIFRQKCACAVSFGKQVQSRIRATFFMFWVADYDWLKPAACLLHPKSLRINSAMSYLYFKVQWTIYTFEKLKVYDRKLYS